MQDRFEKEVQQKMEELRLTPSAPVWEKIEMEIKPEKKRRKVIFWFLLAGLLLAGGGWWAYQSFENNHQISSEESKNNSQNSIVIEKTPAKNSESATNTNSLITKSGSTNSNDEETTVSSNSLNNSQPLQREKKRLIKTFQPSVNNKKSSDESITLINSDEIKKEAQPTGNVPVKQTPVKEPSISVVDSTINIVTEPATSSANDSLAKPVMNKQPVPENLTIDSSLKKKVAANKKWGKQINVMLGGSSYTSGLSMLKSASNRDAFSAIGSGGQGLGGVANNTYTAEPTTGGFGFGIGFSFSRKLSEHWEFAIGLQYTQLTTKTKVGDKKQVDTAVRFSADRINVDEFYTNTGKNNYTNRFHILEIPVTISYRPAIKLPLYISAGVSYGRLISSNALTFSNTSNIYYENDQNYVRNLLPVQASVQYRFRDKKKWSFQTGPVIQYNFLKSQKESTDEKTHLLFAGLKTTINF